MRADGVEAFLTGEAPVFAARERSAYDPARAGSKRKKAPMKTAQAWCGVVLAAAGLVLAAPAAPAAAAAGSPRPELTEKDLDAQRAQALAPIPDPHADYVFGADRAKPAWDGMAGLKLSSNYFGPGADAVEFSAGPECSPPGFVRPSAFYWKLEGLQAGRYHLGL
jgi:hypothetical protein